MKWIARFKSLFGNRRNSGKVRQQEALKHILQGNAFEDAGLFEEAMQFYETAIALAPNLARAYLSRGNIFLATMNAEAALAAYAIALTHSPRYAAAHYNAGNAHLRLKNFDQALASYAQAIHLNPDFADAYLATACVLDDLYRFEEAVSYYQRALDINPNYPEAYINLGNTLNELGRSNQAIESFQNALALKPNAIACYALGSTLMAAGRVSDAIEQFRRAIELDPLHASARWGLAMAQILPIYEKLIDMEESRRSFANAVADLDVWFSPARTGLGIAAVGSKQPFFLAYHPCNNRTLLESYGRLCTRLMGDDEDIASKIPPISPGSVRKLRVGVVSAQVHDHSVWIAITRGWIQHLDPARFEVHVFHLGRYADDETARARREATDFVSTPRKLADWSQAIKDAQLDVLIFPEIGMDRLTTQLAAKRLVAVQIASWGHPQTTGLPTIDLFLSAELFEPSNGEQHYSEKLVCLPSIGVCVEPLLPNVVTPDLSAIGLPNDEPLLLCPGAPFKYSPEHDQVWVELGMFLQAHGTGRLVFFRSHRTEMTMQFEQRLRRAFAHAGADFDRTVCLVPTVPRKQFYGLMRRATLMLDTIGFSGFNTALQALECGLPIVAFEGAFMRGRLASGLLRRIGLDEWVATSTTAFIEKAMRLVLDESVGIELSKQIGLRSSVLFNDLEPVRALEQVLVDAVGHSSAL